MRLPAFYAPMCFFSSLLAIASVALTGCSSSFDPVATSTPSNVGILSGNVHGGRQPVTGARIYMYAAGTGGYGGPGIVASAANASTSLLGNHNLNGFPTNQDSNGNFYVTTDTGGNFSLGGDYTCTSGTQVYLLSLGGQPTPGVTNADAGFLAVLGNCPVSGTLASQTPYVFMNEVSTVAAAYSLAGFASDATHIANSGTTLGNLALKNAAANAAQLYDISGAHGVVGLVTTQGGNGTVPQSTVDSIANSLAACVNSTGAGSAQCTTNLFNAVKSTGTTGITAVDTATEAIYLAQNPGTNVAIVFGNAASIGAPYVPILASAPNDLTLSIKFTGGFSSPGILAADGSGNIWVPNGGNNTVSVLSPLGVQLTGFPRNTNDVSPTAVAIDPGGNGWVAHFDPSTAPHGSVSAVSPAGALLYGSPLAAPQNPINLMIDGFGTVYIPSNTNNTIVAYNSNGTVAAKSGFGGNTAAGEFLSAVLVGAVDNLGNIWAGSQGGSLAISKFSNAGVGQANTAAAGTPNGMAVDASNHVWVPLSNSKLDVFDVTNTRLFTLTGGGMSDPIGVAIDGAGNAFTANHNNNTLSEFSSTGAAISPSTGYTGTTAPSQTAVDLAGNVWVNNPPANTISEFVGLGVPVYLPLSTAVLNAKLGARP